MGEQLLKHFCVCLLFKLVRYWVWRFALILWWEMKCCEAFLGGKGSVSLLVEQVQLSLLAAEYVWCLLCLS